VQVWLKPDVLQRLDAYCAFYGVGRGRAIGHLLQGALPDPNWHPQLKHLIDDEGSSTASEPPDSSADADNARPSPLFRSGDHVSNNSGARRGRIAAEPIVWVEQKEQACGTLRAGLTIRYAEDLLLPVTAEQHQAR
jgi:hypothetical protein